jgi:peptidoglycan/LPS O-acetylase OafA/YrhL
MPHPARTIDSGSPRDVPLEALRGFAALAVIGWHFTMSFFPSEMDGASCMLCGTPLFGLIHGTAAVGVFFTLSGYVLTRRYFITGDKRILIIGALKRYFRLVVPVFSSVILAWLLFHFNLFAYEKAGAITRSGWLITFGFAMRPPFDPNFWLALKQGVFEVLFHTNNALNPILWMIHFEMAGSLIVFAFAALIMRLRAHTWLVLIMALIVEILVHDADPTMAPFVPGCLLAFWAPREGSVTTPAAIGLIALGITFLGYRVPVGFYSMFDFPGPMNSDALIYYTSSIGALLILIALIGCAPLRRMLSGPFSRLLGRLSFPIYLVHLVLLCSWGAWVFVWAQKTYSYDASAFIALAALLPVVLAFAAMLAVIDVRWLRFVNEVFRRVKI